MRILHVLDHSIPLHSGYTFRTRAILKEQHHLGWETFHITGGKQNSADMLEEQVDDLHFYRTPNSKGLLSKLPIINQFVIVRDLAARLATVCQEIKPNIIHAHSPSLNGLAALKVGKKLNIPVVYEVRAFWEDAAVDHKTHREWGLRYRLSRALETYVLKHANAVTTICQGLRLEMQGRGIPPEKITIIPNGVDIKKFADHKVDNQELVKQLHLEDTVNIGFLGSFYAYEGLDLLLRAMPRILHKIPQARILLVGGGPQEKQLKSLAKELGIEKEVVFTGRVSHEQVPNYYELVDVLVYPRLSMRLTDLVTPLKPLEAMAYGKLVVASNVGGHKELIRDHETGVLFRAGDVGDLSSVIIDTLKHKERWPAQRVSARRFVENERNWTSIVERYQPVYQNLLK